jgi:hypothetical protein
MHTLSRREMLILAGAAGSVPLLGPRAPAKGMFGTKPINCTVSTDKNTTLWFYLSAAGNNPTVQPANTPNQSWPISYVDDASGKYWIFRLPWSSNKYLWCLPTQVGNNLTQHAFAISKATTNSPLSISVTANYSGQVIKPGSNCCFMCGDQEICIPSGHAIICDGVEMACP